VHTFQMKVAFEFEAVLLDSSAIGFIRRKKFVREKL
jgi:hypothetical protein